MDSTNGIIMIDILVFIYLDLIVLVITTSWYFTHYSRKNSSLLRKHWDSYKDDVRMKIGTDQIKKLLDYHIGLPVTTN